LKRRREAVESDGRRIVFSNGRGAQGRRAVRERGRESRSVFSWNTKNI